MEDVNEIFLQRFKKLEELKKEGIDPFYNGFVVKDTTRDVKERFEGFEGDELEKVDEEFSLAGRVMSIRGFGKASFVHIQDYTGKIQAYIKKDKVGEDQYSLFKMLDIGDFIGIKGKVFKTRTNELTILVKELSLLTKSLRPLPEKWHGLKDVETRYRQRYLDLIANPVTREIFYKRTRIIQLIRNFLDKRDFLEVETPMMHPIPGGATARPFKTFHNTLDVELYLRIAPELYLKRLLIGGIERVYEINRNFRNEGLSIQHNPEFTMLEFYQAYATFTDLMDMTEEMITHIAREVTGTLKLNYQGQPVDLTPPWKRIGLKESLIEYAGVDKDVLEDKGKMLNLAKAQDVHLPEDSSLDKIMVELFEKLVEPKLQDPTFVTHYPIEVSPLSRRNKDNPDLSDRFELFMTGREMANAFSELNDPVDQKERFINQLKEKEGEEETTALDDDFIKALEYGMPPAAGEGIGIDRLVMLLTDSPSIREVIFFPQLRPEK
ncbi:MAG: lysine--tRNA ligase [Thermodesulfobacteriota bacterium]